MQIPEWCRAAATGPNTNRLPARSPDESMGSRSTKVVRSSTPFFWPSTSRIQAGKRSYLPLFIVATKQSDPVRPGKGIGGHSQKSPPQGWGRRGRVDRASKLAHQQQTITLEATGSFTFVYGMGPPSSRGTNAKKGFRATTGGRRKLAPDQLLPAHLPQRGFQIQKRTDGHKTLENLPARFSTGLQDQSRGRPHSGRVVSNARPHGPTAIALLGSRQWTTFNGRHY